MTLPFDFTVKGKPSSVNGTKSKKNAWQAKVLAAATTKLAAQSPPWSGPPHTVDVTVKLFFFPTSLVYIDVDNGIKHTIDAFNPPLLENDKTVMRVIAERFLPKVGSSFVVPAGLAPVLIDALRVASGALAPSVPATHITAVKVEHHATNTGLW